MAGAGALAEMNMGMLSVSHWIIVLLVVFLLFGPGRISDIMGDLGKGLGSFRKELTGGEDFADPMIPHGNGMSAPVPSEPDGKQVDAE